MRILVPDLFGLAVRLASLGRETLGLASRLLVVVLPVLGLGSLRPVWTLAVDPLLGLGSPLSPAGPFRTQALPAPPGLGSLLLLLPSLRERLLLLLLVVPSLLTRLLLLPPLVKLLLLPSLFFSTTATSLFFSASFSLALVSRRPPLVPPSRRPILTSLFNGWPCLQEKVGSVKHQDHLGLEPKSSLSA